LLRLRNEPLEKKNTDMKNKETLACLIIDDPYLRPKYGALEFKVLLEKMKVHRFFTEIAFIPWNYRRNNKNTVKLFMDNPEHFSICVHGCHHTRNEFGITDYEKLSKLASTSMALMNKMKIKSGLNFDPVMVFPQGLFSTVAIKVLKEHGFSAAFNSTIQATDINESLVDHNPMSGTRIYHDFPLFLRRYPKDKELFLEDIKNGKPIIVVEHSSVFKNGYNVITDLVDWINNQGNIKWASLSEITAQYAHLINTEKYSYQRHRFPFKFEVKVLARRLLSEFRDDYLQTDHYIRKLYRLLKK
jgi:hypothetical protein